MRIRSLLLLSIGFVAAILARPAVAQTGGRKSGLGAVTLRGNEPGRLSVGAGVFDVAEEGKNRIEPGRSAAGLIEYRVGRKFFYWGPLAGIHVNDDGGAFGYGGFYLDLGMGRWTLSPILTLGGYRRGDGKDLGGTFQFQTGASLGYELPAGSRVGFSVTHISDAGIYDENPGAEVVFLSYSIPIPEGGVSQ